MIKEKQPKVYIDKYKLINKESKVVYDNNKAPKN